jgi:hypothetical protein
MTLLMSNEQATKHMGAVLTNLRTHPIRTAEAFRKAILEDGHFGISPAIDIVTEGDALAAQGALVDVVSSGRMIDFGYLPSDLLAEESHRSREMFEAGEFEWPYEDWFAVSSWEGGMCGYLFTRYHLPKYPNRIYSTEFYGVALPGELPTVLLYDIIGIEPAPDNTTLWPCRFVVPQSEAEDIKRASNSLDPLVTFLRILSDASIPVIDRQAPEKLNKARAKAGKRPIPSHHVVETKDYVSAFRAVRTAKPAAKGGHHASPRSHWRRAHKRMLASGRTVTVRSSRVNWREPGELHRLFYRVPVS